MEQRLRDDAEERRIKYMAALKGLDQDLRAAVELYDSNGDGQLTRDEVLAHSRTRFDRLDANGDGLVSPDEYGARLVNMFARMDTNGNGILEGDELPRRMKKGGHHKGHIKTPGADS